MTPREILGAQETNFQRMLDLAFAAHPYYRRGWGAAGIRREAIRSLADLDKLPLTRKETDLADPEAFRLRVEDVPGLPAEERTLWDNFLERLQEYKFRRVVDERPPGARLT